MEVDFRWPAQRLIVEVDGWAWHSSRAAFSADRARDRRALSAGWRVARYPADEITGTPAAIAIELHQLLFGGQPQFGAPMAHRDAVDRGG